MSLSAAAILAPAAMALPALATTGDASGAADGALGAASESLDATVDDADSETAGDFYARWPYRGPQDIVPYVKAHAARGDSQAVLNAIDAFSAYYPMYKIGAEKGKILEDAVAMAAPLTRALEVRRQAICSCFVVRHFAYITIILKCASMRCESLNQRLLQLQHRFPFVLPETFQPSSSSPRRLFFRAAPVRQIGTFVGYSAIRVSRRLAPGGRLTCVEANGDCVAAARELLAWAGLAERVEVVQGLSSEVLPQVRRGERLWLLVGGHR